MRLPPMPSIAGMLSSIAPTAPLTSRAPAATAARSARAASLTRKAMAQALGPCSRANFCARLGVDDEIDIALAVERHLLGAVPGDTRKAHGFEQTPEIRGI